MNYLEGKKMVLKKVAGFLFIVAFLMAIVLFTRFGSNLVPLSLAKLIFLISGAVAILLNLISFRQGKHSAEFNLIYWIGSILLFLGLVFKLMHWPYSTYIILGGIAIVGISFIYNPSFEKEQDESNDLLDSK